MLGYVCGGSLVSPKTRAVIANGCCRFRNRIWKGMQLKDEKRQETRRRHASVMNIAANGRIVTRVTPAQPSLFSSCRAVEPSSCCKVNAGDASLLGIQAQLQVSVANQEQAAALAPNISRSTFRSSRMVKMDARRSHRQKARVCKRKLSCCGKAGRSTLLFSIHTYAGRHSTDCM